LAKPKNKSARYAIKSSNSLARKAGLSVRPSAAHCFKVRHVKQRNLTRRRTYDLCIYLFSVKYFLMGQDFERVELLLQTFDFDPGDTQTHAGALALQADVVVGVRSDQADLRARYYQPALGERWRPIALPQPSAENLHTFYETFHTEEPPAEIDFDSHTTAQYLAGYVLDHSNINMQRYDTAEAQADDLQAGGLYMLGSDIWPYSHSVLGTDQPAYTLSTLGERSLFAYVPTIHIMQAYRATYLRQLVPQTIE
jgi:hypothetical protein